MPQKVILLRDRLPRFVRFLKARPAEVADLYVVVGIQQQILGLQVSMNQLLVVYVDQGMHRLREVLVD